jgi:hypothetical protein
MSHMKSKLNNLEKESQKLLDSALKRNLILSVEERIQSHESACNLMKDLIKVKRYMKRPKDLQAVQELIKIKGLT